MSNNSEFKIIIDKLYDIDININIICEKITMILEIIKNIKNNYENHK